MKHTLRSGLTIGLLVAALAMTGGCGDNDNSTNGNDNNGSPRPTSTPGAPVRTATATPGAPVVTVTPTPGIETVATVDFDLTVTAPVQGFKFDAGYPTAKGNFEGSAENVNCTLSPAGGTFVPNDNDTGTLKIVLGNAVNLTFPINIECKFAQTAGNTLTTSDLAITVTEVTQNGAVGDPSVLTVAPTVTQP